MAGGTDEGPNPLEIFLSSLPACICTIGRIIAMQRKIDLRGIQVEVEGDINKDFFYVQDPGRAFWIHLNSFNG